MSTSQGQFKAKHPISQSCVLEDGSQQSRPIFGWNVKSQPRELLHFLILSNVGERGEEKPEEKQYTPNKGDLKTFTAK